MTAEWKIAAEFFFPGNKYENFTYCGTIHHRCDKGNLSISHAALASNRTTVLMPYLLGSQMTTRYFKLWVDLGCPTLNTYGRYLSYEDLLNIAIDNQLLES